MNQIIQVRGNDVNTETAFLMIAISLGLVLMILLLKKRMQLVLNFLVRSVLGAIGIIFANDFLATQGIAVAVGLNPISVLTIGTLGFGGFAMLYGIVMCKFL